MLRKLLHYMLAIVGVTLVSIFMSSPMLAQTFNPKEFTIDKRVPWGNVKPGDTLVHRWQRSGTTAAVQSLQSKSNPSPAKASSNARLEVDVKVGVSRQTQNQGTIGSQRRQTKISPAKQAQPPETLDSIIQGSRIRF